MPFHHIPEPADRPDVEVRVDGAWYPGELRMWIRDDDGTTWCAQVQWRPPGSTSRRIDTFPEADVRESREYEDRLGNRHGSV